MSADLIARGLECYTAGDFQGAARWWRIARELSQHDPQLHAYLKQLAEVAPGLVPLPAESCAPGDEADVTELESAAESLLQSDEPEGRAIARGNDPWAEANAVLAPVEVDAGGTGLDLVTSGAAARPAEKQLPLSVLLGRMHELLALDNFSVSLELAQAILEQDPQHAEARRVATHCRERLQAIYLSKVGDLTATPSVVVAPGEVIWLDLDHRAGFVLAQVDGASTFEEIIELTGMGRLETLRILSDLLHKRVIAVPTGATSPK